MPRVRPFRKIEHTMSFMLFMEPKQEVHLLSHEQCTLPSCVEMESCGQGSWAGYRRIVNDFWGMLYAAAVSSPRVVLRIEDRIDGVREHAGPWMERGCNFRKPVIRRSDILDVRARALPGFTGEVAIHLAWMFVEADQYGPPVTHADLADIALPLLGADPPKR